MDKLKVFMLDSSQTKSEHYMKLCQGIAQKRGVLLELKHYSSSKELLFDLDDKYIMSSLSILIIEPAHGCETVPAIVREMGYKGLVVYLSDVATEKCYLQAFDAGAFQFLKK